MKKQTRLQPGANDGKMMHGCGHFAANGRYGKDTKRTRALFRSTAEEETEV